MIASEHQGEGAVAGDVAGGAKAVLKGKDSHHQTGAGVVKSQHTDNEAQRCHDRAAGHTGSTHGENAQQEAEEDHGAQRRQLAIEHLGYSHHKEHLSEHRAAQVNVGKQGYAEIHQILAQHLGLLGAPQRHRQSSAEDMVPTAVR